MSPPQVARAEIVVDLAAIRHNVRTLKRMAGPAQMMTVVKADGYGHGMVPSARAAREAGAEWLGVATIDEALALREAGDTGRVLCWLGVPGEDYAAAVSADIDVTAYSLAELDEIRTGVGAAGRPARLQLKVDTGLSRGGAPLGLWPGLVAAARDGEGAGHWRVTGVWSHPRAATSRRTRPTTRRNGCSVRRSPSPRPPDWNPRSATSRTRQPRSCVRRPGSTSCGAGWRRTDSTRRPAGHPTSAWFRR
jgi:alanine racemase